MLSAAAKNWVRWVPPSRVLTQLAKEMTFSAMPSLYWMATSTEEESATPLRYIGCGWMMFLSWLSRAT